MIIKNISNKKIFLAIALISAAVLILSLFRQNLDRSFFLGLIFNDAKEFTERGTITSDFMPIGYTGFLSVCIKIGGTNGIPACQSFVYIGILLAAFWFLRLNGLGDILLILGIMVVAFHPVLFLNTWRIHDGNLTALLLLGFLTAGIVYMRFGGLRNLIIWSISLAFLFVVRQNTLPLFLVSLVFLKTKTEDKIKFFRKLIVFFVVAFVFVAGANLTFKQKPFFFGNQGFYNLFSGTNEYASKYLVENFSGENSLEPALKARGFVSVDKFEERLSFPAETYRELAIDYVKKHPIEYLKLTALKIYTFFRPGYHLIQGSQGDWVEIFKRILKIILAAPFFIWLFFFYKTKRKFFEAENLFVFLTILLYVVPFFIANSDPRYRFPLDIIFIVDSFRRANLLGNDAKLND